MFAKFILLVTSITLLISLGCGKPNSSVPQNLNDLEEVHAACDERRRAIEEWERRETDEVENDFIDGKITLMRAMVRHEQIEETVREMELEVQNSCTAALEKFYPPSPTDLPTNGPFPTMTPSR